jgi:hypothetical protein
MFGSENTIRDEEVQDLPAEMHLNLFAKSHCSIRQAYNSVSPSLKSRMMEVPTVAVWRNPFDRMVSIFSFARKHNLLGVYGISDNISFSKFVNEFCVITAANPFFFHGWSQARYIKGADEIGSDFFLLPFHDLRESLQKFLNSGVNNSVLKNKPIDLPHLNSTPHSPYKDYYLQSKTIDLVMGLWNEDFLLPDIYFPENRNKLATMSKF